MPCHHPKYWHPSIFIFLSDFVFFPSNGTHTTVEIKVQFPTMNTNTSLERSRLNKYFVNSCKCKYEYLCVQVLLSETRFILRSTACRKKNKMCENITDKLFGLVKRYFGSKSKCEIRLESTCQLFLALNWVQHKHEKMYCNTLHL